MATQKLYLHIIHSESLQNEANFFNEHLNFKRLMESNRIIAMI